VENHSLNKEILNLKSDMKDLIKEKIEMGKIVKYKFVFYLKWVIDLNLFG